MEFKKAIVGLDFSEIDEVVLKYVSFISGKLGIEMVYFIHVTKDLEKDKDLLSKYKNDLGSDQPLDVLLENTVKSEIKKYLKGTHFKHEIQILEGKPAEQIIHWANVKNADLIIMGKKDVGSASGILAKKIARASEHSILFVSENADNKVSDVLVPLDFSENSREALQTAIAIQKGSEGCNIRLLHVYDVPAERYRVLRSYEQILSMFEEGAQAAFKKFSKTMETKLDSYSIEYIQDDYLNTAKQIYRFAKKSKPDLLVTGARGHSKLELLIIGSVTENLLMYYDYSPVLVVK